LQAAFEVGLVAAAAPQHLGPAEDGRQRRALVRQRGQELVLELAGALGLGARQPLRFVEPRIVDGHGGLRGDAADDALGALGEAARLRVAEHQAADHGAGAQRHRHRQVAHRRVAGRHAVVGRVLAVARILQHVVAAHHAFAAHAGAEQGGGARLAVLRERGGAPLDSVCSTMASPALLVLW
jgi:hypothetical protein